MDFFKVYLAGKIRQNDWRHGIVDYEILSGEKFINIMNTTTTTIIGNIVCTGPYFISCDHGCYHGENTHGVGADGAGCDGSSVPASTVPQICANQINRSDFVFAYIEENSCYGTLCEIGYAVGRHIPVAVMFANESIRKEMWFIAEMAHIEFDRNANMLKAHSDDKICEAASKLANVIRR